MNNIDTTSISIAIAHRHCKPVYKDKICKQIVINEIEESPRFHALIKPFDYCAYQDIFFLSFYFLDTLRGFMDNFSHLRGDRESNYCTLAMRSEDIPYAMKYLNERTDIGIYDVDKSMWIRFPTKSFASDGYKRKAMGLFNVKVE